MLAAASPLGRILLREQGGSETLNAILMISVLVAAAMIFPAIIIMSHRMQYHSAGVLMEHRVVPDLAAPAGPIRGDAG
jgi:hypothetical protein